MSLTYYHASLVGGRVGAAAYSIEETEQLEAMLRVADGKA